MKSQWEKQKLRRQSKDPLEGWPKEGESHQGLESYLGVDSSFSAAQRREVHH